MKNLYNFSITTKIYFLIMWLSVFCFNFLVVGQNKKMTPERRKELRIKDSIAREIRFNIIQPNIEKYKALKDYVFSDTANLYQYEPKQFSLATLDSTSSWQEKIEAITKVKAYKNKRDTIHFTIQDTTIYLKGIYFDGADEVLGFIVNIDKEIFLIDLNNDGIKELLFYPNFDRGLEGQKLVIWVYDKRKKQYQFIDYVWTDGVEHIEVDKNSNATILQCFEKGCCGDYADKVYRYKIFSNHGKLNIKLDSAYAFSFYYSFLPKKQTKPNTIKLNYTSYIYSKPIVRDKEVAGDGEYFSNQNTYKFAYTYCIGKIPQGTTITELATYTNPKGEKWRFVILEKGYKPDELINFESFKKDYQIYAWLPPENYDKE